MSDALTIDVIITCDHRGVISGVPDCDAGEELTLPFSVGAKLVALGYAVGALPDETPVDEE